MTEAIEHCTKIRDSYDSNHPRKMIAFRIRLAYHPGGMANPKGWNQGAFPTTINMIDLLDM